MPASAPDRRDQSLITQTTLEPTQATRSTRTGTPDSAPSSLQKTRTLGTLADTLIEDPDLYWFLRKAATRDRVPTTRVADGRTPFDIFWQQRFPWKQPHRTCSEVVKQRPCRCWLEAHADPADTVLPVGIDWSEQRRTPAIERGWAPWTVTFPMCNPPT